MRKSTRSKQPSKLNDGQTEKKRKLSDYQEAASNHLMMPSIEAARSFGRLINATMEPIINQKKEEEKARLDELARIERLLNDRECIIQTRELNFKLTCDAIYQQRLAIFTEEAMKVWKEFENTFNREFEARVKQAKQTKTSDDTTEDLFPGVFGTAALLH